MTLKSCLFVLQVQVEAMDLPSSEEGLQDTLVLPSVEDHVPVVDQDTLLDPEPPTHHPL